jgi:anti-sigma B factor antagonist
LDASRQRGRRDGAVGLCSDFGQEGFFSMLKFTTQEVSGVLVMAFEATDDIASDWQSSQRDWLYKLIESHKDPRFAIDLSDVDYLASSEIGFLVTIKRRIDRRQGRVVMFGLGSYIREIFATMNLIKILDVVDDFPSALIKLDAPGK